MAKKQERRTYEGSVEAVQQAVERALADERMKVQSSNPGRIEAGANISIWSWGENVTVDLASASPSSTIVTVTSASKIPITLFDWGKNKANIKKVFGRLDASLSAAQPSAV